MTCKPVVFWDIDGTLVSGSLERSFLRYLRRRKIVGSGSIALSFLALALRFPTPEWHQLKLCYLRGMSAGELNSQAKSCWWNELEIKFFTDAQKAVDHFSSVKARQVILSGTITPLAEQLAARIGIGDIIAAEPEIVNGACSGRTIREHPHGKIKVTRAEEWLAVNGFAWSDTVAIANHWQDRFLLEKCNLPIAAHPDDKLRAYASARNWLIVDDLLNLTGVSL
jgi:phosphoserine phosphatase